MDIHRYYWTLHEYCKKYVIYTKQNNNKKSSELHAATMRATDESLHALQSFYTAVLNLERISGTL